MDEEIKKTMIQRLLEDKETEDKIKIDENKCKQTEDSADI